MLHRLLVTHAHGDAPQITLQELVALATRIEIIENSLVLLTKAPFLTLPSNAPQKYWTELTIVLRNYYFCNSKSGRKRVA